jgi:hypothetical protein
MKFTPITLLDLRRNAENAVIAKRMPKFRSILKYKGRTLPQGTREDFESLALAWFSGSVRLHLQEWQAGKRDKLMSRIATMALRRVLRKKYSRDRLMEEMKGG